MTGEGVSVLGEITAEIASTQSVEGFSSSLEAANGIAFRQQNVVRQRAQLIHQHQLLSLAQSIKLKHALLAER